MRGSRAFSTLVAVRRVRSWRARWRPVLSRSARTDFNVAAGDLTCYRNVQQSRMCTPIEYETLHLDGLTVA